MAERIGVVIHRPLVEKLFREEDRARLDQLGEVRWADSDEPLSREAAIELLDGCRVGIGSWGTPNVGDPELVERCPDLRLWEHVAGSVKGMFKPHLSGREITIATCKTAIADNVAEMTLGQILLGVRGVFANAQANRAGRAPKDGPVGTMFAATVGVVGASEVGQRVLRLLAPFGCRRLLYDPYVDADRAAKLGAEHCTDLVSLCRRSDAVTIHTPLLDSTRGLLGAEHFQAMPDHALFINSSRGPCIDQDALQRELERGRLFACLDVTVPEPLPDDHPLRRLDNCLITSHLAGPPGRNMGRQAVDDVAAFLKGDAPLCVITPDMLERIA